MKTVIEPINSILKKVTTVLDAALCLKTKREVLSKLQSSISLPGFRKGKVPYDILERRYAEAITKEVQQVWLNEVLEHLTTVEKLEVAALLKFDFVEANDGSQTVLLGVEIVPEFELPDYKNFSLEEEDNKLTEAEVEEFIMRLRKQQASYEVVTREAQDHDYVKIAYEGFLGDVPVDNFERVPSLWKKQKSTWEEVGGDAASGIPEIVSGIIGMKVGDKKEIRVTFPSNFSAVELQGKEGVYNVELQEVREVKLPAMDERFFKECKVENLDALNEFARKTILERKQQAYASQQKQRISSFLIQSVKCELPSTWVKRETEIVLQEMVNLFSNHGIKNAIMEEQKESVVLKARAVAEDRIKLKLCFDKIAHRENLKLEGEDIEPVLIQESIHRKITVQKMLHMVQKDPQLRHEIQQKSMQAKMINWLFNQLVNQSKSVNKMENLQ